MTRNLPKNIDCLAELIALPSVSSVDPAFDQSNSQVVNLLANWFEDAGCSIEIQVVSEQPEKLNLIARMGEGEGGLVLSGHTDTVPFDEHIWEQDPLRLVEKDNRLYGLGASDMKCFFPLVLETLNKLEPGELEHPVFVLGTADEESTMAGAIALAGTGKKLGRHALIGEPTGLRPVHMHKGILMAAIRLIGRSGHSSDPSLGNSALEGMYAVIGSLMEWRTELQSRYKNCLFDIPVPTLNFGSIHGGDNANRICASCELAIDLRLLPEMELELIHNDLRKRIVAAVDGTGLDVKIDPLFDGIPGMQTDANAEIIKVVEKLTGKESGTIAFGTEGPFLNSMGMETVILGPGDIDVAHQANEYIGVDRIQPMLKILEQLVEHFCIRG
jgi:acetylornithine deacetylase